MTLLRAGLFNLYFALLTVGMGLGAFWVRLFAPHRALAYATAWCRLSVDGLRWICGIAVVVRGREHLSDRPVLVASQHQSAFDTLIWLTLAPRPAYVMKRELIRLPLVGPMLLLAGMIPVDRDAGAAALRQLLRAADEAVRDRRQIIIFPEGTRVAPGEIVRLQPGIAALAAHTGLPVLPVATDSGRCWSRRAFLKHRGIIHIDIGAPIDPASLPGPRRAALLEAIRHSWSEQERRMALAGRAVPHVDKSVGELSTGL